MSVAATDLLKLRRDICGFFLGEFTTQWSLSLIGFNKYIRCQLLQPIYSDSCEIDSSTTSLAINRDNTV